MTQPSKLDVAAILTEVGVDASSADPGHSVGNTTIVRLEQDEERQLKLGGEAVKLGGLIGEGETSAVYLGVQKAMRRKVAIRTVHPHRRTANAPGRILSEGWMLGAFEHPNIIPVYGLARDSDGMPLVLMKAIETATWTEILETPNHPLGCPKHTDALEFNIERLIEVCGALEHAHFRGVIHRDIKPDNILVGRDGTTYLHGWALGVSLVKDPTGRFPAATEQTQIAGTPAYMAPELATRDAASFGVATDVYLLGATLHDVVTGEPRHLGENVFDALYSAAASTPVQYDPERVPAELATILNKAMAARPSHRFESVKAFRHALEAFLRHRPSERLGKQARRAHEHFAAAVAGRQDDFIVRELFATAYTAYSTAQQFWARNPVVAAGLDRISREMLVYELEHGSPDRARDLLARLAEPAPELQRRIDAVDRMARTAAGAGSGAPSPDSIHDRRGRGLLMIALVVAWSGFGFGFGLADLAGIQVTVAMLAVAGAGVWLALGLMVVRYNDAVLTSQVKRYILGPFAAIAVGSAAIQVAAPPAITPHGLVVEHFFLFFVAMATLNALVDWRLVVGTTAYLAAYIIGSSTPEHAYWLMGASNLIALGFSGYIIHGRFAAQLEPV